MWHFKKRMVSNLVTASGTSSLLSALGAFRSTLDEGDKELPPGLISSLEKVSLAKLDVGKVCISRFQCLFILDQHRLVFSTPPFRKPTPSLLFQPIYGLALYFYAKIKGGRSSPLGKLTPPLAGYLLHEATRLRCNGGGDVRRRILSTEQSTSPGIIKYTFPCQHETTC